jgi:hypothetical protein
MKAFIWALAFAAVWAGVKLDERQRRPRSETAADLDRWEGEGGPASAGG